MFGVSTMVFEVARAMLILNCQTKANTHRKKISTRSEAVISRKFLILSNVNRVCCFWLLVFEGLMSSDMVHCTVYDLWQRLGNEKNHKPTEEVGTSEVI